MIKKLNGVRGFIGTTYAVFDGKKCIKIVLTKKEAVEINDRIKIENSLVQETFKNFKEQLKYYSVEKLKMSNVFSDYISDEIAENAFNAGYELTTAKVKELTEKVWNELENFEKMGGFENEKN